MSNSSSIAREPKRLLVVEDEKSLRSLFAIALSQENRVIETCCDGLDALHAVRRAAFDLILLDLRMPRLDGYNFLKQLRLQGDQATVIICSAELSPTVMARFVALGVVAFLSKPFSLSSFRELVRTHLSPPGPTALERALRRAERLDFERAAELLNKVATPSTGFERARIDNWRTVFEKLSNGEPTSSLVPHVRQLLHMGEITA